MEVSGKRSEPPQLTASFSTGSSEDFDFFCEPCASESIPVEASGYCKNCQEFLCSTCFASHRRVRLTKNHILLDKTNMPTQQKPATRESECTVKCPKHPKEVVIYFCASHEEVGCHVCMSTSHSKCVNEYIPDIAHGTKNSLEYQNLLKELDDIELEAVKKEEKAETNKEMTEQSYSATIHAICEFRKDVNDHLDKLQHTLSKEAQQVKDEEQASMESVLKECNFIRKTASTYKDEMKASAIRNSHAFVLMKLCKSEIQTHPKNLLACGTIKEARIVDFQPNDSIRNITDLGKLVFANQSNSEPLSQKALEDVSRVIDKIHAKSEVDTKDCEITGIDRLSEDKLVLADFANSTVKIIDLNQKRISLTFKVIGKPWDLTVLRNGRIAVAFTRCIQIFCKSINYQVYKKIKIDGECRGIANLSGDKIAATFEEQAKIVVLSYDGDILNIFPGTTDSGETIFGDPEDVAGCPKEKYLYVCDYAKENITKLSMDGTVTAVSNDVIEQPRGITVSSDGSLYVCDFTANKILKISADLSTFETVLTEKNGLHRPLSVFFCEQRKELYVSCQYSKNKQTGNELLAFKF